MAEYKYVVTISRARGGREIPETYCFCAGTFDNFIQAADEVAKKIQLLVNELKSRCYDKKVLSDFERSLRIFEADRFAWTREVYYTAPNGTPTTWFFHIEEIEV